MIEWFCERIVREEMVPDEDTLEAYFKIRSEIILITFWLIWLYLMTENKLE